MLYTVIYYNAIVCDLLLVFQMPLTAAEKQKRYIEKRNADSTKRAEFLQKERESWHKRKTLENMEDSGSVNCFSGALVLR